MNEFSVKLGDLLAESDKKEKPKTENSPSKMHSEGFKKDLKQSHQGSHISANKEIPVTQHKGSVNIQDQFLNHVRREKTPVSVRFVDGTTIQGHIKSFDNFCIQLESNPHCEILVYKHGISSITQSSQSSSTKKD